MIYDKITHLDKYGDIIPEVKEILHYLETHDLENMVPGKYDIDGERLYVMISEITTQEPQERMWEGHFHYADLQIPVKGTERYGFLSRKETLKEVSCDREKDICFLKGESDCTSWIVAEAMEFVYFLPEEMHKPCCSLREPSKVKKAVFKIMI